MIPLPGRRPGEALARIREEIRRAQAEALGRTGEGLDAALADLAAADRLLDTLPTGAPGSPAHRRRREAIETRNRLRARAQRLVESLIIQREALGLRHHAIVAQQYPVPPPRPIGDDRIDAMT